jgi:hypothetical protein
MDESADLTEIFTSIEVHQVIVRACTLCGGPRTQGEPCAACGNLRPPVVHDLGQTTGVYRDAGLRGMWDAVGRVAAEHRIRKANAQAALLRRDIPADPR